LAVVGVDQLVPCDDGRWRDEEPLRVQAEYVGDEGADLSGAVRASLRMLKPERVWLPARRVP